jgi:predicted membrane protein
MNKRSLWGALLILIGVGFLCETLGVFDFSYALKTWWPLIFIAIGIIQLLTKSTSYFGGFIFIFIGTMLQLRELGILPFSFSEVFWPSVLILIGIKVILPKSTKSPLNGEISEDVLDHFVAFSGINSRSISRNFKGGSIFAAFGGVDVDLRDAGLSPEGAMLELTAAFGGIDVKVPENWNIVITGVPIFGGWEDKTRNKYNSQLNSNTPVLKIKCVAAFGGIEIKN